METPQSDANHMTTPETTASTPAPIIDSETPAISTTTELEQSTVPKKRGPKLKSLSERPYQAPKARKRRVHSYTREQKVEVLMWLEHHKVNYMRYTGYARPLIPDIRKPTQREAADFFKISLSTVSEWCRNRQKILEQPVGTRRSKKDKAAAAATAAAAVAREAATLTPTVT